MSQLASRNNIVTGRPQSLLVICVWQNVFNIGYVVALWRLHLQCGKTTLWGSPIKKPWRNFSKRGASPFNLCPHTAVNRSPFGGNILDEHCFVLPLFWRCCLIPSMLFLLTCRFQKIVWLQNWPTINRDTATSLQAADVQILHESFESKPLYFFIFSTNQSTMSLTEYW